MDNLQIEREAISKVQTRINLTKYLSSYLDDNDKTPSWDGFVYIYGSENKTKDNLTGRLPAQVKGHESNNFSDNKISFSIEIAHLRNYLNDIGAVLFVVYLSPNKEQTDFNYKIYYAELTPIRISALISECPVIQQKVSVHLKVLPSNPDDFASLILNCFHNCKRQSSFAGAKLPTIKELDEKGLIESIQFFVSGYGDEYKNIHGFLKLDTPLYVRIKGAAIPQPVKFEGEMVHKVVSTVVHNTVSSEGNVFYTEYKVVESLDESVVKIGHGFTMTVKNNTPGCKVNFKASHMLREFVDDAPFMIAFIRSKQFMINDMLLDFTKDDFESCNINLEAFIKEFTTLQRYVEMMDKQGCTDDVDFSVLTDEDWRNLERLAQATLEGKPVYGLQNDMAFAMAMSVGPLKFGVGLTHVDGEKGVYNLCHIQDCKDIVFSPPDHNEVFPVPLCAIFKPDDYVALSNIKYDQILPAIRDFPVNEHTYGVANDIMLRMVLAADKTEGKKRDTLLNTAMGIAEWLITIPNDIWDTRIATLNRLQIIIRKRALSEEERGVLFGLIASSPDREDVLFAANALLGKKDIAKKYFYSFPQATQDELMQYPIYHFIGQETDAKDKMKEHEQDDDV